ncbi:MAG: ROK family transcriptional regulator [Bifidobacteriaceae bacterium]|jgi:predicted NBD/HSP70 family sugar kinase|nr:ROK family transcriptional regulator [Bifidobacteriaceae bacterium]
MSSPKRSPGSQSALRRANLARVLDEVRLGGPMTQAEIARRTGLSAASVTNLVRLLSSEGLVQAQEALVAGRRSRIVTSSQAPGWVLGIDIGRTHICLALADLGKRVVAEVRESNNAASSAAQGLELCRKLTEQLLEQAGVDKADILATAACVPGPLDGASGQIGAGALLPEWTGINLADRFQEALGLPVIVENDANLGAYGEWAWPSPRPLTGALAYLRLATGIGCGLVLNGQLYRGSAGTAGEIGHMTIEENGRMCRCGNRGCLETVASAPVMLGILWSAMERRVDLPEWVRLARSGHTPSVRLMEEMARYVGAAVANLANLISPELVVLGGPVAEVGQILLDPVREEVLRRALPAPGQAVRIELARHGGRSEVYGALHLATQAALASLPAAIVSLQ